MNSNLIGAIILVVILGIAGVTLAWLGLFDRALGDRKIDVTVTLKNTCSVEDRFFVAYAPESGRFGRFSNGVAKMRLNRGETLRLAIDPAYPAVSFGGYDERAKRNVELIADCLSSERQKMINRTLREQFGN